ncbi:glutathionylspermidine synthase [Fictibacillus macauensis ZFHKF-1]|uniref:Glutathionylspermidine synthase n=1 Tax=Fictibacillus macauensis ZFHKF-1 TaxID=1196324 RepID=I8IVZ3_9BACL|nr:glutathionylspermidine synthase [Fictibacillus macauensis ZFHKF-1]
MYALYDIAMMDEAEVQSIRCISERIVSLYDKTAPLLRSLDDHHFMSLGIPEEVLPYIRMQPLPVEGIIRRLDLVKTATSWKHYELNADTPTFIVETHEMNHYIASEFGARDANEGCKALLQEAIVKAIYYSHLSEAVPKIVFTAHESHVEDWNTSKYLGELSGLPHELLSLDRLIVVKDKGLFTPSYEKIDVLYRQTYPIEHLVHDVSVAGDPVGLELLDLVKAGKLAIINPLSAFLLQSKAVQAVIWSLHMENSPYFSAEEHEWIEAYFIPSFLDASSFIEQGKAYVEKPCFGREGDSIKIYDEHNQLIRSSSVQHVQKSVNMYQEYVELPQCEVKTPDGIRSGHYLVGSFVIGDEAGAIGIRVGNVITGNESCFLAVGMR